MKLSFVIPIYNDAYLVESFCENFEIAFQSYLNKKNIEDDLEIIFVNDGSSDNSILILEEITLNRNYVKVIDLSRNFGQHIALSCGYKHAIGEFIGMLNVDQQEPPSELTKLLDYMILNNYDIVFGTTDNRKTSFLNNFTSRVFAVSLNYLTNSRIPLNVTTIRIMNRKFIDAYNELNEKSRYLPGLETWLGFKHGYLPIMHNERDKGKSAYNFKKRISMAFDSIISFSDFPLKLIVSFGIFIVLIGFLLILYLLISKLFLKEYVPGYTSTISIITFIGGLQILVIGLASLYVGRILKEVQNRPLYVINKKIKFK